MHTATVLHFASVAMMRMSGAIQKSTDVMKGMSALVKLPEIQASMMELSKEMTKVSDFGILRP